LWDLESNDEAGFLEEVNHWHCTNLIDPAIKWSVCNGSYIMGGYNIMRGTRTIKELLHYGYYWERNYTGLPAHNQVNLTFTIFPIDSWVIFLSILFFLFNESCVNN